MDNIRADNIHFHPDLATARPEDKFIHPASLLAKATEKSGSPHEFAPPAYERRVSDSLSPIRPRTFAEHVNDTLADENARKALVDDVTSDVTSGSANPEQEIVDRLFLQWSQLEQLEKRTVPLAPAQGAGGEQASSHGASHGAKTFMEFVDLAAAKPKESAVLSPEQRQERVHNLLLTTGEELWRQYKKHPLVLKKVTRPPALWSFELEVRDPENGGGRDTFGRGIVELFGEGELGEQISAGRRYWKELGGGGEEDHGVVSSPSAPTAEPAGRLNIGAGGGVRLVGGTGGGASETPEQIAAETPEQQRHRRIEELVERRARETNTKKLFVRPKINQLLDDWTLEQLEADADLAAELLAGPSMPKHGAARVPSTGGFAEQMDIINITNTINRIIVLFGSKFAPLQANEVPLAGGFLRAKMLAARARDDDVTPAAILAAAEAAPGPAAGGGAGEEGGDASRPNAGCGPGGACIRGRSPSARPGPGGASERTSASEGNIRGRSPSDVATQQSLERGASERTASEGSLLSRLGGRLGGALRQLRDVSLRRTTPRAEPLAPAPSGSRSGLNAFKSFVNDLQVKGVQLGSCGPLPAP